MIKIVQKDEKDGKILRKIAKEVSDVNKVKQVITDMKSALDTQADGVAIAAPQIGESYRIFCISDKVYMDPEYNGKKHTVFINPEIIKMSKDRKKMSEGCLSVRPWYGKVKRSSRATVKALDENGNEFIMDGSGLIAQIFQHEIDHLDGILFIDKAEDLKEIELE